jgi:Tfp pilus assembly protein PilE
MKINKKEGISLIVLVITLIVIIILAGAVILSLSANNSILQATKATYQSDLRSFQTELDLYKVKQFSDTIGSYNPALLQADASAVTYNGVVVVGMTINNLIPSLTNNIKYNGQFHITNGQLIYGGYDFNKQDWTKEIGVLADSITPSFKQDITNLTNGNVKVVPEYSVADRNVNMLNNGDFLNGLMSWTQYMPDTSVTLTYIDTPYGKGVKVAKTVGSMGDWPLVNNATGICKAGKTYTFSWYYRVTQGSGRPYLVGWWALDNGTYRCNLPVEEISLGNGWIYAQASYKFTSDFTMNRYTFVDSMADNITVEFANIRLTESTMQYKIGLAGTWTPYTSPIELTSNATVYAKYTNISGDSSLEGNVIVANIDKTKPIVAYSINGGTTAATVNTIVTASDANGINTSTLQYVWDTQNTVTPVSSWTIFTNGATINKTGVGTYYLWIKVTDNAGNITIDKTNAFIIT